MPRTAAWTLALLLPALTPAGAEDRLGLDVSHHSGAIEWETVLRSHPVAFVYVKATEGVDDADPMFQEHWKSLGDLGVPRGAYHFYVTEDDPEEQARFFLSQVELQAGDLPPAVDIELIGRGTEGELAPKLQAFLDIVHDATGVAPVIYTGPKFWNTHLGTGFGAYPLWIAQYEVPSPVVPDGWETWHLWQYEGDGRLEGIEKDVDLTRVHPDLDLDALRIAHDRKPE